MTPTRIYFIHGGKNAKGEHLCEACAEMAPVVERFKDLPGVRFVEIDLTTTDWTAKRWQPRMTPTVVVLKPNGTWVYHEGATDAAAFVAWLSHHVPMIPSGV